jgi:hypothetical protein
MNAFGIDQGLIEFLVDRSSLKQGRGRSSSSAKGP